MIQQHHSLPKRTVFVLTDVSEVNGRDPISYWAMSEYTFTKKPVLAQKKKKISIILCNPVLTYQTRCKKCHVCKHVYK